ncbi:MAG: HNH endonuclease, partial [Anaeromyxobacteraceae bacterium]
MNDTRALAKRLAELLSREHGALADFLVALADFDRERRWLELGHSSLFYFLHRELGLSKGAAFYRKTAAELLQRYPEVVEPLRSGKLCLSTVVELAKVITPENRDEVVARF